MTQASSKGRFCFTQVIARISIASIDDVIKTKVMRVCFGIGVHLTGKCRASQPRRMDQFERDWRNIDGGRVGLSASHRFVSLNPSNGNITLVYKNDETNNSGRGNHPPPPARQTRLYSALPFFMKKRERNETLLLLEGSEFNASPKTLAINMMSRPNEQQEHAYTTNTTNTTHKLTVTENKHTNTPPPVKTRDGTTYSTSRGVPRSLNEHRGALQP